jgi:hypothetical protein
MILDTHVGVACSGLYSCCYATVYVTVMNDHTDTPFKYYRACVSFSYPAISKCSDAVRITASSYTTITFTVYIPKTPPGSYTGTAWDEYRVGNKWYRESSVPAYLTVYRRCLTQLSISVKPAPCR